MEAAADRVLEPTPLPAAAELSPPTSAAHDDEQEPPQQVATVLRKIEKWWFYRSYGDAIAGSRVIPMKTPLTLELQERQARLATTMAKGRSGSREGAAAPGQELGEQQEHTIGTFVRKQAALGRTVGLIVDLSNHECLYAEDMERDCPGLAYQHFHFVAKCVPDSDGCALVARCITAHLSEHPDHYVGIHCSYGFNRTGLVCCAYLVEELGFTVDQALAAFAASRPPGVKHQHFVDALRSRYGASSDSDGAPPASTASTASTTTTTTSDKPMATGIIPPAESEPDVPASLVEDLSTSGIRAGNNETLGGDVREAMLVALQQHQQQEQRERESSSTTTGSPRSGCGRGSCAVS